MIEEFKCLFCNEYGDSNIIQKAHIIPRSYFLYLYNNFNYIKNNYNQIKNLKNISKFKKDLKLISDLNKIPKYLKNTYNNNILRLCCNCHTRFDTIIHKRNIDNNRYFYRLDKNKNNNYKFLELDISNNKSIVKYNNIIIDLNKIDYINLFIKLNKKYINTVNNNKKPKNKYLCCKKKKKIKKKKIKNIIPNIDYNIINNNMILLLVQDFNNHYN